MNWEEEASTLDAGITRALRALRVATNLGDRPLPQPEVEGWAAKAEVELRRVQQDFWRRIGRFDYEKPATVPPVVPSVAQKRDRRNLGLLASMGGTLEKIGGDAHGLVTIKRCYKRHIDGKDVVEVWRRVGLESDVYELEESGSQ